jgi:hypothetical protein
VSVCGTVGNDLALEVFLGTVATPASLRSSLHSPSALSSSYGFAYSSQHLVP